MAASIPTAGRRRFRLSFLELLLIGLIAAVLLYVASLWLRGEGSDRAATPAQTSVPPPTAAAPTSALLERALAASEKVQARLDSLEKDLQGLARRVEALEKALKSGTGKAAKADPALRRRLAALESRLKALARVRGKGVDLTPLEARVLFLEKKVGEKPSDQTMDARLTALEKRLARLGSLRAKEEKRLAERLSRLERTAATRADLESLAKRLAQGEKAPAGTSPGSAPAALALQEARLQRLEMGLRQMQASLTRVRAPVPDPAVEARLARLEKRLAALARPSRTETTALAELERRLATLEQRVRTLARTSRAAAPSPQVRPAAEAKPAPKVRKVFHKVRRGQTLYGIARRYGVKVSQIKDWNPKLKRRRHLWVGETLVIYLKR